MTQGEQQSLQDSTPVLCELRPWGKGETLKLTRERVLIGSHRLCDVTIHAASVAPVGCQLVLRHGWWYVRNLTDTCETKVNGLSVSEDRLLPGDVLWIGANHKYEVCYEPASFG